jgi:hypothetical protein
LTFNYTLHGFNINNDTIYYDASDKFLQPNMQRPDCLNKQILVISETTKNLSNLHNTILFFNKTKAKIQLLEDGHLSALLKKHYLGYSEWLKKNEIESEGLDIFSGRVKKKFGTWNVKKYFE